MVQRIFKVRHSSTSNNGWEIEDQSTGTVLDLPAICLQDLDLGKYLDAQEMLDRIDTMQIALAGVTDSLNIVDEYSLNRRSVLKTFSLKQSNTIDDTIDEYLESVKEYEKYHTIYMDRDKDGNDNSIHAYLVTPKDGILRCTFDKSIRLNAKRNNIKYWTDDYKIDAGANGGKFVRPIGTPIEIM
ncbi:MAG: hypothetical protein IJZ79_02785 [Bacilli bacterium]|nr:hypothetical protein [Bacilli bacterium]MBQ8218651.1 hypothetical protein [Bacilli bacterium]